ncbi:MFS transporter [Actinokineospora enzanensis]|uniref:MFS transporter n=1 Tax=Actinokineospora enzanensis TaxID=155975 RepID=UPI000379136F|nr:MFS transporter [Actinokineospora enzanensis]
MTEVLPAPGRGRVILVAASCLTTLLLSLLDINIVSAVSWRMVADLDPVHGIALLPWLTTSYALADCVVVPLYGKLVDVHGPRPVFLVAMGTFLVGSCLCGIARSMTELIVFRTLQGVGAGGLTTTALTIIGILFRTEDAEVDMATATSARSAFASVLLGLGLALGPSLGGLVADTLNWRWVFYLNLPLSLAAFVIVAVLLRLPAHRVRRRVDFLGAALIGGAGGTLLLCVEWGGKRYPWGSSVIILLAVAGVALLAGFVRRVTTAAEPLISLSLLRNRVFRITMPSAFLSGLGLSGALFYVGGYLQVGRGLGAAQAGLASLCMAAGLVAAAFVAKWIVRLLGGFKYLLFSTGVVNASVLLGFSGLDDRTSYVWVGVGMFVIGVALGQSTGLALSFTQNAVPLADVGIASASLRFNQQLGVAFGYALFSTIISWSLGEFDPAAVAALPPDRRHAALDAFISATDTVFLVAALIALVPAGLALLLREPR